MVPIAFSLSVGVVLLYLGAEGVVRGSSRIASRFGVAPLVIGLTVVAYGTSTPELVVSSQAALSGHGAIAAGNVIGSNILNIALILGLAALVRPLRVESRVIRLDMPVLIIVSLMALLFILDGTISRGEGFFLCAGGIGYTVGNIFLARREAKTKGVGLAGCPVPGGSFALSLGLVVGGFAFLVGGSRLLITGAVTAARASGLSEAVIAMTLVALGTSLPELATSVVAAVRKEDDVAMGNVVGSNIFNILCVLGVAGLLLPFPTAGIHPGDVWIMLAVSLLLLPLMKTGFILSRREGMLLLLLYAGYIYYLWIR